MAARNGPDSFGWISRLIHWAMAVAIIGMLGFGTWIANMQPSLSNLWMYGAHKSVGLCLLALVVLRLIWHRISPPPALLSDGIPSWQMAAARWVHRALYALMLAVPLTGWIGSSATGINVVVFGLVTLPPVAPLSEAWDRVFFALHGGLTKLMLALLILHAAGAVLRHVRHGDRTLRRMIGG
jgi:cytochrome b561